MKRLALLHPRRPLLAVALASVTVCWLVLVLPPPPSLNSRAGGPPSAAALAAAALFPAPEGPLPDPAKWRGLSDQEVSNLSGLGRLLFLNDTEKLEQKNKTYKILVWKHGKRLERRHIRHFTDKKYDPFENCSVSNCHITYEDGDLSSADAVVFHLHLTKGPQSLPPRDKNNTNQRWIFLTDESPHNTFLYHNVHNNLKNYPGIFNWSMSYRMDSDVPVPYGRTVPLTQAEALNAVETVPRNYAYGKTRSVAIMGSNCGGVNHRWDYVRALQKHMRVDVFGACGNFTCPGHFTKNCPEMRKYKFYLAFENSNCKDYLTEKLWWNAYKNELIPVVMGATKENCQRLLPRRSYLHVEDFASPADLARFLIHLDESDRDYNTYFQWKYEFKILNEHGYFQSPVYHYCRICEALNYNNQSNKVYDHPEDFWSVQKYCND